MGDASGELPSFAHEVFAESEERVVAREPSRQTPPSSRLREAHDPPRRNLGAHESRGTPTHGPKPQRQRNRGGRITKVPGDERRPNRHDMSASEAAIATYAELEHLRPCAARPRRTPHVPRPHAVAVEPQRPRTTRSAPAGWTVRRPLFLDAEVHLCEELDVEGGLEEARDAFVTVQSGGSAEGDESSSLIAFFFARPPRPPSRNGAVWGLRHRRPGVEKSTRSAIGFARLGWSIRSRYVTGSRGSELILPGRQHPADARGDLLRALLYRCSVNRSKTKTPSDSCPNNLPAEP